MTIISACVTNSLYTNHCVRATSMVLLEKAGFDYRAVCNITGHKNVQSLDSYCGPSEREIRSLSSALDGKTASCSSVSTSACSLKSSCEPEEFSEMSTCGSIADQGLEQPNLHFLRRKPYSSMLRSTSVQVKQSPTGHAEPERCRKSGRRSDATSTEI